jgi:hypothetical protein
MNTREYPKLNIAEVNASLADAEKAIEQARGALGNGDSTEALNRLSRAFAIVSGSMKTIRGDK